MISEPENLLGGGEEGDEIEEKVDPRVFKADLYAAANANKTDDLLKYLGEGVPPTHIDEKSGWTPLHWAATHGNVEMVSKLLEHGASAPYHRMVNKEKNKKLREARALEDSKKSQNSSSTAVEASTENPETLPETDAVAGTGASESKGGEAEIKEDAKSSSGGLPADTNDGASVTTPGVVDASVSQTGADGAIKGSSGNTGTAGAPVAEESDEDDDDVDYETAMERKLETSINLLKNTPLLWAAAKGHLRVLWLLLLDGYSPNDLDDMGNNALHLAAPTGNVKILRIIVDDGAYSTKVNMYKNLPLDMATHKECRHILMEAMEKGASMTAADIASKHDANLNKYMRLCNNLDTALSSTKTAEGIASLQDILRISSDAGLPLEKIALGEKMIQKLDMGKELVADLDMVQKAMPIRSQDQFDSVHRLERTIQRAKEVGADAGQITFAEDLISRCEIEYWVGALAKRLQGVIQACDTDEHDMDRLKEAIAKGTELQAHSNILEVAANLCKRLYAELGMTRALVLVPTVKMPLKEGAEYPEDYWGADDLGHIVETEGYPNPPAETNEYVWSPSKSYTSLQTAIAAIKAAYVGAEDLGANSDLCIEAKTKLAKCEKDFKILHLKNETDKLIGIENTAKMCKKKGKPAAKK